MPSPTKRFRLPSTRRAQIILRTCGFLLAAASTGYVWHRVRTPRGGPLETSLWYWHRPFRVTRDESSSLRAMGVRRLFVRAGTLSLGRAGSVGSVEGVGSERPYAAHLRLLLPQQWERAESGLGVELVFNFAQDAVRAFERLPNEDIALAVNGAFRAQRAAAEQAGFRVVGVQLDYDVPTRLLPKYADLLRRLRGGVKPLHLSITTLASWLPEKGMREVAGAVDFLCPQFYEAEIPRRVDGFVPISSLKRLERGLQAAERLGKPYYAGIPSYGHALVYDRDGALLGAHHDMSVGEAMRHPSLRLQEALPVSASGNRATVSDYIGEDRFRFFTRDMRPDEPDAPDHGKGRKPYWLVYDLPSERMPQQQLAAVRARHGANCKGIVLYRYPEPGETASIALPALAAITRGARLEPRLVVTLRVSADPFEEIDTGETKLQHRTITATVANEGSAGTAIRANAATVILRVEGGTVTAAERGAFDVVTPSLERPGAKPLACSIGRANRLDFARVHIAAGERVRIGPIHIESSGPLRCSGEWSAVGPGGFQHFKGEVTEQEMTEQ